MFQKKAILSREYYCIDCHQYILPATIVFLMSDTGGGHRASAESLEQALRAELDGKKLCCGFTLTITECYFSSGWSLDIKLLDIWTAHGSFPYNKQVPAYKYLGKHPGLWRFLYYWTAAFPGRFLDKLFSKFTNRHRLQAALDSLRPDMIISVHPLVSVFTASFRGLINSPCETLRHLPQY